VSTALSAAFSAAVGTPVSRPARIVIVSPALADANNGNWQTAQRWLTLLAPPHAVRIAQAWPDAQALQAGATPDDIMLALHARRSAASIAAWAARPAGTQGLAVVLTGTDLYRDIAEDAQAQRSLALAAQLVVLQERGPGALPEALRRRARVIFQSGAALPPVEKPAVQVQMRALMVGHLRTEKSPSTLFDAARLLQDEARLFIDHIGAALDPALGAAAKATAAACPHYRWLGGQPHKATRRHIQRAHVLVHASEIEGGAHVIMEAVLSGTPVLASRIAGNVGMLGEDYAGYFEPGDAVGLAALLRRCAGTLPKPEGGADALAQGDDWLALLRAQCDRRAALFTPALEAAALARLVADLQRAEPQA
jgi:putative glycosyltransferase (TIGR04348 family)